MTIFVDVITQACRRWSTRREHTQLDDTAYDHGARLYEVADPAERAEVLTARADAMTKLAITQPVDEGQDQVVATLSARADLLRLAAVTEQMLVDPTDAETRAGLTWWLEHVPPTEARVWLNLAHTADRTERAELLTCLAEMASDRLGTPVAEVLRDVADSERALTTGPRQADLQSTTRWAIAAFFATVAAVIGLPMVPGFNTWPPALQLLAFPAGPGLVAVLGWLIWRRRGRAG